MSRVAVITDTHIGARGDSLVVFDYFNKFYQDIFFPYLLKNDIKTILHLGDVFDKRKTVNLQILNLYRQQFLHPLENMGCRMIVTAGNHDCYYNNTNKTNSPQELLGGWDNVEVHSSPSTIEIDGVKVLLLPWRNQSNEDVFMAELSTSEAKLAVGHLEIAGFKKYKMDSKCDVGMTRDPFERFDLVLSGHFHHKSSDKNIHYLGQPYEMTFSDLGDPKGFHILDLNTLEFEFIQNPYKMFHSITYDDKGKTLDKLLKELTPPSQFSNSYVKVIVQNKTNPYYFDKFTDLIFQVQPADVKIIESNLLTFESEDEVVEAQDTITILDNYIDQQDISLDKETLKQYMHSIHDEAVNMEVINDSYF
jgi:DNA repair exonuclease SbcCD nuclease subunit